MIHPSPAARIAPGRPRKPSRLRALLFLVLAAIALPIQADVLSEHPGHWLGSMQIPGGPTLRLGAELFTRADGSAWASIAVPDQGVFDIPVSAVHATGDGAELQFDRARLKLSWAGDHFNGSFQETGGPQLDFALLPVDRFPSRPRSQTPRAPFPYREQILSIRSTDGVVLGATLSVPADTARPNLVVLVHGSGPNTRDEGGTFLVLADYLARQGVAVVRFDKRGVGRSTGSYDSHTEDELAEDVYAVLRAMRARHQFARIGLVGHSEGPGIAAAIAARHPRSVDFLVSLAGVGLGGLDMLLLQDRATAIANGASAQEAERIVGFSRRYYQAIIDQPEPGKRVAVLKALDEARPAEDKALADRFKMRQGSLSVDNGFADKEFLRVILMADAPADWRRVRCPVLALNGSLDRQVPVESLAGIVANLAAGGNRHVQAEVLPSLNHQFQTAVTGAEDEYERIDEIFAPVAMQRVAAFVAAQR